MFNTTFDKIINLLKNKNVDEFTDLIENVCSEYDLLIDDQWASSFEQSKMKVVDNPLLPVPRIEMRWRESKYKTSFGTEDIVCDLGLVFKFGKELRYDVMTSTKVGSTKDVREDLYVPFRKEGDIQALIYQLKIPAYVSYKDNYKEIKFPQSQLDLVNGVRDLMTKEEINKLSK